MKRLRFHEILLMSQWERSARRISFHDDVTVIKAANDFGKSCLMKSLYSVLGATPHQVHPSWKKLEVTLLLEFSIDRERYRILKLRNQYSLFNAEGDHVATCASITKELGPLFANLFDFHLQLSTKNSDTAQATPALLFLPFYIDQDRSWIENWSSFERLGQFQNYKKAISQFHTGLKPNAYYLAMTKQKIAEERQADLRAQRDVVGRVLDKVEVLMKETQFDIDFKNYQNEVERLVIECNALKKEEERHRDIIVALENQRALIQRQMDISEAAANELKQDFDFSTNCLDDDVECPMCGAEYHNSFAERFGIAADEDNIRAFLASLKDDMEAITAKLQKKRETAGKTRQRISTITELLDVRQGEIRLRDIVKSEGKKEVRSVMRLEIDELNRHIGEVDGIIRDVIAEMKTFTNRKRTSEIQDYYRGRMSNFLELLEVTQLSIEDVKEVSSKVNESGSDLPRALLAFYFAVLKTIDKYSTSTFCPILLDSPKQQDQDDTNWRTMMEFIRDHRPNDSQLVIALVDDAGVDLGGDVVELTDKRQLLQSSEYEAIAAELRPYIDATLAY